MTRQHRTDVRPVQLYLILDNNLKALTIRTPEFTHAKEFEQGESESSKDTVMIFWPFVAGGATIIIFLLVVVVCCIVHKRKKTLNQSHYANSQQVRDASKDQIIYENDHEFRKNVSKGKKPFSSVYINRPENKTAIYVNSAAQADETYANCNDNDYENVE
ncbi:hypothetical protein QQF64_027672 [Cirrhinus molitorella]|uniref:Uncharacterized protein n=1 Tax=Cirrhinus molitorella TaxID=172907 RepID=A0ABR3ND20_9TELE